MINIQLQKTPPEYLPGETIIGDVEWSVSDAPIERIEFRLIWFTQGKGNRDVEVVDQTALDAPPSAGSHRFEFTAPDHPYSFSGKLISLVWTIEVIAFPDRDAQQENLTIAPGGQEIRLQKRKSEKIS